MTETIEHIVVLMFENRSFDQMLGSLAAAKPQIDGIDAKSPGQNPWQKPGTPPPPSVLLSQQSGSDDRQLNGIDPPHDYGDVMLQISGANSGFVNSFEKDHPEAGQPAVQQVMDYFARGTLSSLHTLAENFLVCDRWFASVPGPTWPNRFFAHSGTSMGHVDMDVVPAVLGAYDQTTIYDLLEGKVSWAIYYGDIPQSLLLKNQHRYPDCYRPFDKDFVSDCAGPANQFPSYVFIEPSYFGPQQSDQHPAHGVLDGEALIATVYNSLRGNQQLWETTLLIVLFDEHGGFYDHVYPDPDRADLGATVAPDQNTKAFSFAQLGVRVPAILVSPWIPNAVTHTKYDHTSILRYVCDKWALNSSALGKRVPQANGFNLEFVAQLRADTPASLRATGAGQTAASSPLTEHQRSLLTFTQSLEGEMSSTQTAQAISSRLLRTSKLDSQAVGEVVRERIEAFLTHQSAALGRPRKKSEVQ